MGSDTFFEEDEPAGEVRAAFDAGEKGLTRPVTQAERWQEVKVTAWKALSSDPDVAWAWHELAQATVQPIEWDTTPPQGGGPPWSRRTVGRFPDGSKILAIETWTRGNSCPDDPSWAAGRYNYELAFRVLGEP